MTISIEANNAQQLQASRADDLLNSSHTHQIRYKIISYIAKSKRGKKGLYFKSLHRVPTSHQWKFSTQLLIQVLKRTKPCNKIQFTIKMFCISSSQLQLMWSVDSIIIWSAVEIFRSEVTGPISTGLTVFILTNKVPMTPSKHSCAKEAIHILCSLWNYHHKATNLVTHFKYHFF